jgi:hypothetical protein
MLRDVLIKFGNSLRNRRNFLIYSVLGVGIPSATALVWVFGRYGPPLFWVFLVGLAFSAALLWGILMWERLPNRYADHPARESEASETPTPAIFEYEAHFGEHAAKTAEREFYLRAVREAWFWQIMLPPLFFGVAALVFYLWLGDSWFARAFGTFSAVSLLVPVVFYFARPVAAARLARRLPVRRVRMTSAGLLIETGGEEVTIPWRRFRDGWDGEHYVLLVIGPHMSVNLPKLGMPDGAETLMKQSIRRRIKRSQHRPER